MSSFIVSARKYRPSRFDEIVGQNHVTKTLKNALKTDHVGQSFLFCGPRGVGKTTSARILAKVLNCENKTEDFEPCNECNSCQDFNENHSFNIFELDAASNNSVENIRDLVDQVRFPPQNGQYKVYIIDEVHMLSQNAFNAFLKTLEEPPSYAIFILATTEKHKIIPTILSRCQIFDFNRVQVNDMVEHLQSICTTEHIEAEESALHVIAQKADGALRDALSIFDRIVSFSGNQITYDQVIESLNILDYDTFFELTESLLLQDKNKVLLQFDDILNRGFDGDQVILGAAEHMRNLLVSKNPETIKLLEVAPDVKNRFQSQAELAKTSFLLNALNIANACDTGFKLAKNKRLHVELALLKMCYLNQIETGVPLPQLERESVKKKSEPKLEPKKVTTQPEETPQPNKTAKESKVEHTSMESTKTGEPAVSENQPEPAKQEVEVAEKQAVEPIKQEKPLEQNKVISQAISSRNETIKKTIKPALNFNLSTLNNEIGKQAEAKESTEENQEEEEYSEEELAVVDSQSLVDAWTELPTEFPNSPSLQNILTTAKVSADQGVLEIVVGSKLAEQMIRQQHNTLVDFIKKEADVNYFKYEIVINEQEIESTKQYTKEEQLQYIIQNNEAFARLAEEFNLQIDYD